MANVIFNENKIVSTIVSEKDSHGYLRKTDKTDDPTLFLVPFGSSETTYNLSGVFKGTYVTDNDDVKYTLVLADEDPLPAYKADTELPGTELTVSEDSTCLPVNIGRNICAMNVLIDISEMESEDKTALGDLLDGDDESELKLWLIVETSDSRSDETAAGPSKAYCEFLFTKDHADTFAPLYHYEEEME